MSSKDLLYYLIINERPNESQCYDFVRQAFQNIGLVNLELLLVLICKVPHLYSIDTILVRSSNPNEFGTYHMRECIDVLAACNWIAVWGDVAEIFLLSKQ